MFDFRDKLRFKIDPRPIQSGIEKAMQNKKNTFLCLVRFEVRPGYESAIVAMPAMGCHGRQWPAMGCSGRYWHKFIVGKTSC